MFTPTPFTILLLCTITLVLGLLLAINTLSPRVDRFLEKITGSAAVPVYLLMGVALFGFSATLHTICYIIWNLIP